MTKTKRISKPSSKVTVKALKRKVGRPLLKNKVRSGYKDKVNKVSKISKLIQIKRLQKGPMLPTCSKCMMTFPNGVALGGHASKAHPGGSEAYNHKIQVREARAEEREFLVKAKKWFTEHFEVDPKSQ